MFTEDPPYPSDDFRLEDHASIFLVGFRHRLREDGLNEWLDLAGQKKWELHPFLRVPRGHRYTESGRETIIQSFQPDSLLTPTLLDTLFGNIFPDQLIDATDAKLLGGAGRQNCETQAAAIIRERISGKTLKAKQFGARKSSRTGMRYENLLLRKIPEPDTRLTLLDNGTNNKDGCEIPFQIHWADLWFFRYAESREDKPEYDGLATLALKITLDHQGAERDFTLNDLCLLNRKLRQVEVGEAIVRKNDGEPCRFWTDLLFENAMGIKLKDGKVMTQDNLLMWPAGSPSPRNRYSRYAKCMTGARLPAPTFEDHLDWGRPVSTEKLTRKGPQPAPASWDLKDHSRMLAELEGHPSLQDALLYELASTTTPGEALGYAKDEAGQPTRSPEWEISPEYLRQLMQAGGIDIWARWKGLVLHDTCAFLSTHPKMPIVNPVRRPESNPGSDTNSESGMGAGQLEQRYYPLYVHACHARFKLSELTMSIIQHELDDTTKARRIRDVYSRFNNQYWLQEPTVDFQGIEIFAKMRSGMKLGQLYEDVASEVKHVTNFINEKNDRGRQGILMFLILAWYPTSLMFEALGFKNLIVSELPKLPVFVVMTALIGVLLVASMTILPKVLNKLFTRSHDRV